MKTKLYRAARVLILNAFIVSFSWAQDIPKKSRFRFAQTTLGLGIQTNSPGQSVFLKQGKSIPFEIKPQVSPIIYFGGMHFWGHAEFYFAFPIAQLLAHNYDSLTYTYKQNDIFGLKYYPWKLKRNSLRPYFGLSISGISYQQGYSNENNSGVIFETIKVPFLFGISYRSKKCIIELTSKFNFQNRFNYYISREEFCTIELPSFVVGLNIKLFRDATISAEKDYYGGKTDTLFKQLKKQNKLNSWFAAIGPSSAFFLKPTEYNSVFKPYLGQHCSSNVFLEIGLGYFYQKYRAFVNLLYRKNKSQLEAYGTSQIYNREAITFEINKFLLDYHGFVPFVGINIGYESLSVQESDMQLTQTYNNRLIAPGLSFGWDILPTHLEYLTLRTNLRYCPKIQVTENGHIFSFQQLEVNFIQLVFYPQRYKAIKKLESE